MMAAAVMAQDDVVEDVLTWETQDPLVFKGGEGSAADKALYHLIDADLIAEGRATTEGAAPGALYGDFYYKEVDSIWEFHGNLYLETTWDVPKDCKFSFWYSKSDDGSTMADGFHVTFDGTQEYKAYDVMDDAALDYQGDFLGEDACIAAGETNWTADAEQNLQLNPLKSRKTCDGNNCTWQAHWFRDYETGDAKDIQLVPGVLETYYLWGEYDCGQYSGSSDKHRVIMGHLYEEPVEDVAAGALRNLAFSASAVIVALFALV